MDKNTFIITGIDKDEKKVSLLQRDLTGETLKRSYKVTKEKTITFIVDGYKFTAKNNEIINVEQIYETKTKIKKEFNMPKKPSYKTYKKSAKAVEVQKVEEVKEKTGTPNHKEYETIKICIENKIPVYLAGPAGSGKNFTLEQIAKDMNLDFYFTNSVQQEYKLTGFIDAAGIFHETEFYKAFLNGGIFFLDEMDASIPEVLILLNAAIANGYFEFPTGKIVAHEDFRVVAAGNTVGNGADEMYTGRTVLDQATLDRFVIIDFDYDENVEMMLAEGNKELVQYIRNLREYCQKNGIKATFSYRCIITITKLIKTNMPKEKISKIALFKGLDEFAISSIKNNVIGSI